ncbi:MAG TPA: dual specificity protein phosphatase family protein [Ktedonobacterales bacterium]
MMRAELYKVAFGGPGTLSIMARPRGGDWLPDEIQAWRDATVVVVVSLLTNDEREELDLRDESLLCEHHGLTFISYPIQDRDVPQQINEAKSVIEGLAYQISKGKHIAIHCRMGIGRAAMIAATTLVKLGGLSERAFAMVQEARGYDVPDTPEQRERVEHFSACKDTDSTM